MFTWLVRIAWLALGAIVGIWVYEGMAGVDQRESLLPFLDADRETSIIMLGVFWGLVGMLLAGVSAARRNGPAASPSRTHVATGQVIELQGTGTTIDDVPQYDVYVEVRPPGGERFVGRLRGLFDAFTVAGVQPGSALTVRYDPENPDRVELELEEGAR